MRIQKVKISNFKCYKDTFELVLNERLNIIVGNNESGKSTIIDAINLALSGWFKGRYVFNELTQYLFNKESVDEYLNSLKNGTPLPLPSIAIELFFSENTPAIFRGNKNSENSDSYGLTFRIEFDEKFLEEYNLLLQEKSIHSLPIEYYQFYWESFARDEKITPRVIPIKSALIDSNSNRQQNGSDVYIGQIIKNFLETKDVVDISQSHRKMKDVFVQQDAIKNINSKIQSNSDITNRKVELSVELSTKNAWENSLVTYIDDIPFHFLGQGEQSVLKTKLALSHKKALEANILLIEEPENHLSHSKLNTLINDLKAGAENKQIIINTHSSFVANKLGLDSLILLNDLKTIKLTDLKKDTFEYFKKLSGYDTLRLILCKKAILVEGDSDELIVQKAFMNKHENKLPIDNGIDVISVGTSFLRFLEIAEKINKQTIVITDTDWSLDAIQEKYSDYLGANKKDNIEISYDATLDSGELLVSGKPFNYNTLEPKVLKANSLELLNNIFDKKFETEDEMHKFMKKNKTNCALLLFETNVNFVIPSYINDML
jgi:putative ATP-dependent endonuclease of the OLD family